MIHDWSAELEKQGVILLKGVIPNDILTQVSDEANRLIAYPEALDRGKGGYALRHILRRSNLILEFGNYEGLLSVAQIVLGPSAKPVKGILFDKGEAANWSVRWHQDTTISVKQKIETPGFEAWSHKDDIPHVRPPVEIMERIVAFRIHLDDCGEENGPLKVLAGSHRRGYLSREEVLRLMKEEPPVPCTARKGDVLLMRPLIVHSSSRSRSPAHRRVIHIEYSAENLPNGLEWFES